MVDREISGQEDGTVDGKGKTLSLRMKQRWLDLVPLWNSTTNPINQAPEVSVS